LSTQAVRGAASRRPGVPTLSSPANGATNVTANPTLAWSASNATTFDVYFGTQNPPPIVWTSLQATSYVASTQPGTTYYWKIVAKNGFGSRGGSQWSFNTEAAAPPPTAPPPPPAPPTPLAITCPANQNTTAPTTSGIAVSFPAPTV